MTSTSQQGQRFDRAAAVTRSLLGWGVVAGPLYLAVGLALALARDGFDLTKYPLSLLMLGDHGWIQTLNLGLAGLLSLAAAVGFVRALRRAGGSFWAGGLVGGYGVCLVLGALFAPDPMDGFPPGSKMADPTMSGMVHLLSGAIGFLLLASATFVLARRLTRSNEPKLAIWSRVSGAVIIAGFFGGAFMPSLALGVLLLWITVIVIWGWLAAASVHLYKTVPHPDA